LRAADVVAVVQVVPPFDDTCIITLVADVAAAKVNVAVVDVLVVLVKFVICHCAYRVALAVKFQVPPTLIAVPLPFATVFQPLNV